MCCQEGLLCDSLQQALSFPHRSPPLRAPHECAPVMTNVLWASVPQLQTWARQAMLCGGVWVTFTSGSRSPAHALGCAQANTPPAPLKTTQSGAWSASFSHGLLYAATFATYDQFIYLIALI